MSAWKCKPCGAANYEPDTTCTACAAPRLAIVGDGIDPNLFGQPHEVPSKIARLPKLGNVTPTELIEALNAPRVALDNEDRTQRGLFEHLQNRFPSLRAGIIREAALSKRDRVDIWFNGIVVEVKLRYRGHQKFAVYKQLVRYAESPQVDAIILAHNLDMTLPDRIEGKPAYCVSLGRAWMR